MSSKTKTKATKEEATPSLIPKLRFPEFRADGEWEIRLLADLFSERQETGLTELPLLSLMDKEGIVPQEDTNRKNNSNSDKSKYLRVVPGDIAYNTMRMWEGRSAHVGLEGLVSPAYTVCVPQSDVHSLLFSYYFKTPQLIEQFRRYSQGLVKDTLNLKYAAFSQISVPTTSLVEQQKIASCLSSLDSLITAHAQKLTALKTHKNGLMQQLFPREGETVPRLRFSEFQNATEWARMSIQEMIDRRIIVGHLDGNHGELYPKAEEFSQNKEGIPYITANDFMNGCVEFSRCKRLPIERARLFKKGVAIDGDILFAHNATVGPVAKLNTQEEFVILSTTATYFRCNDTHLSNDFLQSALSSPDFVAQYSRVMSQSTRNQVPITTQRKLDLSIPQLPEQQRIATCLSSLDTLITAGTQKLEALKTHKKGLMQGLFPSAESNDLQSISH